jgi:hypothetical protein
MAPDHVGPHFESGCDVGGENQDGVGREERLRERQAPVGAVVERPFPGAAAAAMVW